MFLKMRIFLNIDVNNIIKMEFIIQMNGFILSGTKSLSLRKVVKFSSPSEEWTSSDGRRANLSTITRENGHIWRWVGRIGRQKIEVLMITLFPFFP
jgi:hypothetical protein